MCILRTVFYYSCILILVEELYVQNYFICQNNSNYKYIMDHLVLHPPGIVLKIGFVVAGGGF